MDKVQKPKNSEVMVVYYLSTCSISKTTERILFKCNIGGLY
jgi:hypothetical protein